MSLPRRSSARCRHHAAHLRNARRRLGCAIHASVLCTQPVCQNEPRDHKHQQSNRLIAGGLTPTPSAVLYASSSCQPQAISVRNPIKRRSVLCRHHKQSLRKDPSINHWTITLVSLRSVSRPRDKRLANAHHPHNRCGFSFISH